MILCAGCGWTASHGEVSYVHAKLRKIFAGILVVLGGLVMWLAPEVSTIGFLLLLLGVAIEFMGIYLEHKDSR